MPDLDDAIRYILDFVRNPRQTGYSTYGYEFYLPIILDFYIKEIEQGGGHTFHGNTPRAREISPVFYDAIWELSRRGIFRPGLSRVGGQATDDGASGAGFSLTSQGRLWIEDAHDDQFLPTEPGRFAAIIERYRDQFGDGYFQRAMESVRCYFSLSHLACCTMAGAAAESVLLAAAIAKSGDEAAVLNMYVSASGVRRVTDTLVGQAPGPVQTNFRNLMSLLTYWRNEAAHGTVSQISEFDAYESLARLLRLSQFCSDNWVELTG